MTKDESSPWLVSWQRHGTSTETALERFDSLPPLEAQELRGLWAGAGLPTGHPMDGLLEIYGWYGKSFDSEDEVHPLLVVSPSGSLYPLQPALVPMRLVLLLQSLLRRPAVSAVARRLGPLGQASGPTARLRMVKHRGVVSAAMIYDSLPIIDHFRRLEHGGVLGLMDLRHSSQPFFFTLQAVDGPSGEPERGIFENLTPWQHRFAKMSR